MLKIRKRGMAGGLLAALAVMLFAGSLSIRAADKAEGGSHVAHTVYFKLKDGSEASRAKLAASCKSHLNEHDGTISFAIGTVAADLKGPYNDQDFDVSVHLVFVNKAALDKYHAHPRHVKFVEENKDSFEKIRVFDAYLAPSPAMTPRRTRAVQKAL